VEASRRTARWTTAGNAGAVMNRSIVAILFFALAGSASAQGAAPGGVLSSPKGCFVFGQIDVTRIKAFYMLNACTGQLWNAIYIKSGYEIFETFLQPVPYIERGDLEEGTDIWKSQPLLPPDPKGTQQ